MSYVRLLDQLAKNWGWIALRGAAAVIFGVLAFAWPGVTLVVLALFFGAYAFLDGIFALIAAKAARRSGRLFWSACWASPPAWPHFSGPR